MRLIPIALILLTFSSCATYQYATLDSTEVRKNDKKDFSWENDTMRLTYNFHGEGGPISMTVFNKMDKPLFVIWKKSALIRGGQAYSLYDNHVEFSGGYAGLGTRVGGVQSSSGSFGGSFDLPEGTNLVPPGSFITKNLGATVQPGPLYSDKFTDKVQPQQLGFVNAIGTAYKYRRYTFDQAGSPLQFKSYLTFVMANSQQEFSVTHSFYVQEVVTTDESPELFTIYKPQGDQLWIKKPGN